MNEFESIIQALKEVDYKGVVRKQRSINKLFPDWSDKVKGIAKMGGLRMETSNNAEWKFKIHSGTDPNKWYEVHLAFKNVKELLAKHVKDRRIWVGDKSRVDRRKLAKKMLYSIDIALSCSCPAFQYWGGAYITSLPKYAAKYGEPETRSPNVRNPKKYGMVCKHLQNLINVLPFYETTMAQWLTQFYNKDIETLEQQAGKEFGAFKQVGKDLGKKLEEPEAKDKPTENPEDTKSTPVKEPGRTIRTDVVRGKLRDKGLTDSKLYEGWQKVGSKDYIQLRGKYRIALRYTPEMLYDIVIEEAYPDGKSIWREIITFRDGLSLTQALKKAENWLKENNVLESIIRIETKSSALEKSEQLIKETLDRMVESNYFTVLSHNSYGELQIMDSKGITYLYQGVNPFIYNKVKTFIKHKQYGKAWQAIKYLPVEKLENANS